jgi:hypothetical protein
VVGTLPLEDSLLLKAGEHTVRLSLRGHRAFETTLAVKPGEVVTLHVDHTPDRLQVQRDVGLALGFGVLFALTAVFAATRRRA